MTKSTIKEKDFSISCNEQCFKSDDAVSLNKDGLDKKYNVKFDNDDLALLNELQSYYGVRNKSDLLQTILCSYLKKSLHEDGVAKDVALIIAMVADSYGGGDRIDFDVSNWKKEVGCSNDLISNILTYGPAAKKIKLSTHNGVEHSDAFIQVGMKLLRFCEKQNLIGSPAYKKLFDSIRAWNEILKSSKK